MQEPRDGKAQDGEEKEVIEKGVAARMVEKGASRLSPRAGGGAPLQVWPSRRVVAAN